MIAFSPIAAFSPRAKGYVMRAWRWAIRVPHPDTLGRDALRRADELAALRKEIEAMVIRTKRKRR